MRVVGSIALVLGVLVAGAALVADRVATDVVNAPENRARIMAMASAALGRDVAVGEVVVGLFPLSLGVAEVRVAGATPGAPALVEARSAELRVALAPLVAGAVVVDSLVVEQPLVWLVLTERGLELPGFVGAAEAGSPVGAKPGAPSVVVRAVEVRDARIRVEDRTVSPPWVGELADVHFSLRRYSVDAPFEFDLSVTPEEGGNFTARGTASPSGMLDLKGEFRDFPLEPIAPYLASRLELAGRVTGSLSHRGPAAAPERQVGDLRLDDGRIVLGEFELAGPLGIRFEMSGPYADPDGRFEIDATGADVRLGGVYAKQPGRPAKLTGRVVDVDGALGVDDVHLSIGDPDARSPARSEDRVPSGVDLGARRGSARGWQADARRSTS